MPDPVPAATRRRPHWPSEWRGALNATVAMLPFVLSYGFIAFGAMGEAAAQMGLSASVTSVVLGGLLLSLAGRMAVPAASPNVSGCLILGTAVVQWLRDPALQPPASGALASLLALVGLTVAAAGVLYLLLGLCRAGRLVRYVPQPVLAGFMNGVAILIVISQLPAALGLPAALPVPEGEGALAAPAAFGALGALERLGGWQAGALGVTLGTALLVWVIKRIAPRAPAPLLALLLAGAGVALLDHLGVGPGVAAIGALQVALPWPDALQPLAGEAGVALLQRHGGVVLSTAVLLALIGALDSLLSLATIDPQLHERSDPDRALVAIGLTNVVLGLFGALPVVYLRLRALASVAAGATSWRAVVAGSLFLALLATLGLPLVEVFPKPVVAGIVVMLAWTLVDPWTLGLVGRGVPHAERRQNLAVVAAVCVLTVVWGFAAGVALGVLLSFVILVRALNRSLVRLQCTAAEIPSRRIYPPAQEAVLGAARRGIGLLELEGALFFGNVERLQQEVEDLAAPATAPDAVPLHTIVLDLRRVSTVDASGAVTLARLRSTLAGRGVVLRLAGVAPENRHGQALRAHGVLPETGTDGWALHDDADRATEAAECEVLLRAGLPPTGAPLPLAQCALVAGLDAAALARVVACMQPRTLAAGERLFAMGEAGDALYVLTAGSISVVDGTRRQRFVSFSPGMTFGETALLDGRGRTADAVADEASTVQALRAEALDRLQREAPELAAQLYRNLALHLSTRLREASAAWRRAAG
jgi:MFS superfamily sulfate permease-like transporter